MNFQQFQQVLDATFGRGLHSVVGEMRFAALIHKLASFETLAGKRTPNRTLQMPPRAIQVGARLRMPACRSRRLYSRIRVNSG